MIDFKAMGQPSERRLRTLPRWALEWIETLKYRVNFWHAKQRGIEPGRSRILVEEPNAAAIFGLPWWAQDWMDLLKAEAIDQRDKALSHSHR